MTNDNLRALGVTDFVMTEFMPSPRIIPAYNRRFVSPSPEIPQIAQRVRDITGQPVWINTWANSGPGSFNYRGVRPYTTSIGAALSQHKRGDALDFSVPSMEPMTVWRLIMEHKEDFLALGVTRFESLDDTLRNDRNDWGWIHADRMFVGVETPSDFTIVNG